MEEGRPSLCERRHIWTAVTASKKKLLFIPQKAVLIFCVLYSHFFASSLPIFISNETYTPNIVRQSAGEASVVLDTNRVLADINSQSVGCLALISLAKTK